MLVLHSYKLDKLLIAGIDPGTVGAYALIDINGNLVSISSGREFDHKRIVFEITKHGKVFLVGSDVYPCPFHVEKVARSIGARVVSPDHNLGYLEKIKIVDEFLKTKKDIIKLKNKHEKDALAAALYGLRRIKTLIKKIDDHLEQNNIEYLNEKVKNKVLLENMPISDAVKLFS